MADVTLDAAIAGTSNNRGFRAQVWSSESVGYQFFIDGGGTFGYVKSTDGGASWGSPVVVESATTVLAYDVWFDQWTPGDSGTKIHMAYFDSTADDVYYRSLETSGSPTDSLGARIVVEAESTAVADTGCHVSITKAVGGNLYVSWDVDNGAELGFERSTDNGATWAARTIAVEAADDWMVLLPAANTGDTQDVFGIYQDASADALTVKWYDDSANTWTESTTVAAVIENVTDGTGQYPFSCSIRHSDGHLILAAVTERDTATSDHLVFDIDHNGTSFSVTSLANITTDIDDHYHPSVFIDQDSNDIYVAYSGKRDGSENLALSGSSKVYYTKSTDDGASWSAGDTTYMEGALAGTLQTFAPLMGPRFYVAWRQDTSTLIGNAVNSLTFGGGNVTVSITGVSSSATAGTMASTGGATVDLSGVASAGVAGTVTASSGESVDVSITGAASAGLAGTLTVSIDVAAPITGLAAAGLAGVITATGDAVVSISGVASTAVAGDVTASAGENVTATVTGVFSAGAAGTLTATGDAVFVLTGGSSAGQVGTLTVSAGATVDLTGASAQGLAGTPTVAGNALAQLTGATSAGQAGQLAVGIEQPNIDVMISGVSSAGIAGTITVSIPATVTIQGVASASAAGVMTVTGSAATLINGVSAVGQAGTVTVTVVNPDVTVQLTGVSASGQAGHIAGIGDLITDQDIAVRVPGRGPAPLPMKIVSAAFVVSGGGDVEIDGRRDDTAAKKKRNKENFVHALLSAEHIRLES